MHNLHMNTHRPRRSTWYMAVITVYFLVIVGLLIGFNNEAHASKWQGWPGWCATHPHKAKHLEVCDAVRP